MNIQPETTIEMELFEQLIHTKGDRKALFSVDQYEGTWRNAQGEQLEAAPRTAKRTWAARGRSTARYWRWRTA